MEKPFDFIWRWLFVFCVYFIAIFLLMCSSTYLLRGIWFLLGREISNWDMPSMERIYRYTLFSVWAAGCSATFQIWVWWRETRKPKDYT